MDNAAIHERLAPVKNPLVKSFATRVLKWRQTEGKTLKEVASDLDMSMAIVCEWEHGHRFPSIDALLALSKYTGIPASEFLREPKEGGGKRRPR
jgi:transcriptional regulator with XRE-family HTH domain